MVLLLASFWLCCYAMAASACLRILSYCLCKGGGARSKASACYLIRRVTPPKVAEDAEKIRHERRETVDSRAAREAMAKSKSLGDDATQMAGETCQTRHGNRCPDFRVWRRGHGIFDPTQTCRPDPTQATRRAEATDNMCCMSWTG